MSINERVVRIGDEDGNVGILTQGRADAGPVLVLLNAGWLHHVGSNRVSVRLARRLAQERYTTLRFDFSGLGDSPARTDGLPRSKAMVAEGRAAFDRLRSEGLDGPLLVGGVCSGASAAYRVALRDERVEGAIFVNADIFHYRTFGWYLRRYGPSLFQPSAWRRLLRKMFSTNTEAGESVAQNFREPVQEVLNSSAQADDGRHAEVQAGLEKLLERGTQLLFVFTGGAPYNHPRQFGEMFPRLEGHPRVSTAYPEDLKNATQAFLLERSQVRLAEIVTDWIGKFPIRASELQSRANENGDAGDRSPGKNALAAGAVSSQRDV